jgi:hypothetical protein
MNALTIAMRERRHLQRALHVPRRLKIRGPVRHGRPITFTAAQTGPARIEVAQVEEGRQFCRHLCSDLGDVARMTVKKSLDRVVQQSGVRTGLVQRTRNSRRPDISSGDTATNSAQEQLYGVRIAQLPQAIVNRFVAAAPIDWFLGDEQNVKLRNGREDFLDVTLEVGVFQQCVRLVEHQKRRPLPAAPAGKR